MTRKAILDRLARGMSLEEAISEPLLGSTLYEYNGESLRIGELVSKYKDSRLSDKIVKKRIYKGWPLNKALTELPSYHNGQKVIKPISFNEPHYTIPFTFKEQPEIIYPFRDYDKKNKGEEG